MQADVTITTIAHVIQLAVAPVFLLTGVGALLGVLTNRLSRIVDRRRVLESMRMGMDGAGLDALLLEAGYLVRRGRLINRAISLCTTAALLVCLVIVALFVGAFLNIDMSIPIGLLFIASMLTLVGGLVYFLREIHLAMASAPVECCGTTSV